jgi:hypothetical protein
MIFYFLQFLVIWFFLILYIFSIFLLFQVHWQITARYTRKGGESTVAESMLHLCFKPSSQISGWFPLHWLHYPEAGFTRKWSAEIFVFQGYFPVIYSIYPFSKLYFWLVMSWFRSVPMQLHLLTHLITLITTLVRFSAAMMEMCIPNFMKKHGRILWMTRLCLMATMNMFTLCWSNSSVMQDSEKWVLCCWLHTLWSYE